MERWRKCQALSLGFWTAAAVLAASPPARAADPGDAVTQRQGEMSETQQKSAGTMNVSDADIRSLRDRGYSWGDIGRALVISDESGKSLSDVTNLRDSGMDWQKIAERYNVQLMQGRTHGRHHRRTQGMEENSPTTPSNEGGMREAPSGGASDQGTTSPGMSPNTAPGGGTNPGLPPGSQSPGTTPSTPGSSSPGSSAPY